jgi:hypothetical protein
VIIPPWGSPQRQHRGTLGVAKLEMYDGYYFHGTDNEASVGDRGQPRLPAHAQGRHPVDVPERAGGDRGLHLLKYVGMGYVGT